MSDMASTGGQALTVQAFQPYNWVEGHVCPGGAAAGAGPANSGNNDTNGCSSEVYQIHIGGVTCTTEQSTLPLRKSSR